MSETTAHAEKCASSNPTITEILVFISVKGKEGTYIEERHSFQIYTEAEVFICL